MRKKKFTLVEMLSVVAIIAILCGIIFGAVGAIRSRNAEIKTRAMLKQIEIALNECKLKFGYYPKDIVSAKSQNYSKTSDLNLYVNLLIGEPDSKKKIDDDYYDNAYFKEFIKVCNFSSFEVKEVGGKDCICDAYGEPLQYKSNGKTFSIYSKGRDLVADLDDKGDVYEPEDDDTEHENYDNIYLD